MKALTDFKQGLEDVWENIGQGWRQVSERASHALTHFKPHGKAQSPANPVTAAEPFPLRAPSWALLSGDVFEDSEQVVVRLEVPGLEKQDFDIEVRDNQLVVSGEKHFTRENDKGRYRMLECAYGSFHRAIPLPTAVKSDKASAKYRNGVLHITLPKAEKTKPKQIEVKIR